MSDYTRICLKKNDAFVIYYGIGRGINAVQSALWHYDVAPAISYFKEGEGDMKIEGRGYRVTRGDAVLTSTDEIHYFSAEDSTYIERITLYVNVKTLRQFPFMGEGLFSCFTQRKRGEGNLLPAALLEKKGIHTLFEQLLALAKREDEAADALCFCKTVELLAALEGASDAAVLPQDAIGHENKTVARVIRYIGEHFKEPLSCEEIAARFFISRYHLEHIFKEFAGISLWDYVIFRRLIYFHELCEEEGLSVTDAARAAGFQNYSNFYRLYKKHTGKTPLAYKRERKKR
ncbi:MAG: helix-turn-helix transcriptional regulator [Clostridia bacterium]|nr:helix-turn-helix transcriptional regulator [Clostridia bacterium]